MPRKLAGILSPALERFARGKGSITAAGMMSGTSADGIDVSIVSISSGARIPPRLIAHRTYPYTGKLKKIIRSCAAEGGGSAETIAELNYIAGAEFGRAVKRAAKEARIPLSSIDIVGSHGQTVAHPVIRIGGKKKRVTFQIGDPAAIREHTGMPVVSDFRYADIAAGGQGAPLTPYLHRLIFARRSKAVAVNNLGGISNVTYIPPSGAGKIVAFDTGPANMLLDMAASVVTNGKLDHDKNGAIARNGKTSPKLLKKLMRHPYFGRSLPKSAGRSEFGETFFATALKTSQSLNLSPADFVNTIARLTAVSIADQYRRFLPELPDEVVLCGGGAKNPALREMIALELAPARVITSAERGYPTGAVESMAFAVFAAEFVRGIPANIPEVTGASRQVVLGRLTP